MGKIYLLISMWNHPACFELFFCVSDVLNMKSFETSKCTFSLFMFLMNARRTREVTDLAKCWKVERRRRQKSFQRVSNLLLLLLQWEIQRNHEQGENLSESANFESPAASDLLLLPTWISWRLQKISCTKELKVVKAKAHFTKAKIFIFKIFSKSIQNGY